MASVSNGATKHVTIHNTETVADGRPVASTQDRHLYYRKATPPDLVAARAKLAAFGIKVTKEVHHSLRTSDRRPAEQLYVQVAADQEAEWQRWRDLLRDGPQRLSHKQIVGLAADYSRAFLAKHEDQPFDVPGGPEIPVPSDDGALKGMVAELAPSELAALKVDLASYLKADDAQKRDIAPHLLARHPAFMALVGSDLATALETMHGGDTDVALSGERLNVDAETRRMVNLGLAGLMGAARRGLEARQGGDYQPIPELQAAPPFTAPTLTASSRSASALSLIDLLDHKARTRSIRPKTVSDNKAYLRKFIAFVGFDDARRVEKKDVRAWRDTLAAQTDPVLSPKTIRDRYISSLKSALSHGVAEFDLQYNAAEGITDRRETENKGRKEWTEEEALLILKATFSGSPKALSIPHRRALFWVPWMLAYTGLRVGEITQLQGRNLITVEGISHLIITPFDGNTKGGNAWAVGIHQHLIDLGLLDFIREVGDGPLFYEPDNDGVDLTPEERRSRVLEAYKRVGAWVTDELGLVAPLGRPNHAWRHRFELLPV